MVTRRTSSIWIVVADATCARVHSVSGRPAAPELVLELDHPAGRLHSRDLASDRPGEARSDMGSRPQSLAQRESPAALERDRFARRIAAMLDEAHAADRFDELALVMPPKLLGLVREHLEAGTRQTIVAELARRFTDRPVADVVGEVEAVRRPAALA